MSLLTGLLLAVTSVAAVVALSGVFLIAMDIISAAARKRKDATRRASESNAQHNTKSEADIQKESEKNALDILEDFAYINSLDKFKLVEIKDERAKYQYAKNGYLFTIGVDELEIGWSVKKGDVVLLHYIYDQYLGDFEKKQFATSLIAHADREGALEILSDFADEVVSYEWEALDGAMEVINDLSGSAWLEDQARQETKARGGLPEDPFGEAIRIMEEKEIDADVIAKFRDYAEKIGFMSKDLEQLKDQETKHMFERLIKNDLLDLASLYVKLRNGSKLDYKEQIVTGLDAIGGHILMLETQIENRNVKEVEKLLHIIQQRYKEA